MLKSKSSVLPFNFFQSIIPYLCTLCRNFRRREGGKKDFFRENLGQQTFCQEDILSGPPQTFCQDRLTGGHILGISWAYLRHISGMFQAYPKHISGISQAYLKHISNILKHISGISQLYLKQISGISQSYLKHNSKLALQYLKHI